ncbi:hypothetical protein ACFE04_001438 [Oxalis oulophora]
MLDSRLQVEKGRILIMGYFCFSNCYYSMPDKADTTNTTMLGGQNYLGFHVYSYNELKIATCGFSHKIGESAFGSVCKGQLKDGTLVAVKVLSIEVESMRGEREFISELSVLSNIKHENLVTLQGCCVDGSNRYLVYDYMENNSLAQTLLAVIFNLEHGEHYLVQEVWKAYNAENLIELVDSMLGMNYPEEAAIRFMKVGLLCMQETARLRPKMSIAFKMLNNEIDITDVNILQPGLVHDLMDIKLGQNNLSQSTESKYSSTVSMTSRPHFPSF